MLPTCCVRGGYQISKRFLGNRPNISAQAPDSSNKRKTRKTKKEKKRPTKNDIHEWIDNVLHRHVTSRSLSPARKKKSLIPQKRTDAMGKMVHKEKKKKKP